MAIRQIGLMLQTLERIMLENGYSCDDIGSLYEYLAKNTPCGKQLDTPDLITAWHKERFGE